MAKTKPRKVNKLSITEKPTSEDQGFFNRISSDIQNRQSYLNLILGALIVVVLAILLFNYFNKPASDIGPSNETQPEQTQSGDVAKEGLPGKYIVKEGDTLFIIAQKYYDDGYKYTEIMKANNITNPNFVEVNQVLEIPKLDSATPEGSPSPSPTAEVTPSPESSPEAQSSPDNATGGAENQTIWGEKITSETYTVVEGDWLSKIAGRAYGDVMSYTKIAQANNIQNPDLIEPGMTLKIPR